MNRDKAGFTPMDDMPPVGLRARLRVALACLRGRPVLYRVWFGEHPADVRVSVGPDFQIIGCRFSMHHTAPPEWPELEVSFAQAELPESETLQTISRYVRNVGSEPWYGA